MPVLTGILLDVSGSMEQSVGGPVHQEGGSWARSIFKVVDDLIKHDVSSDNLVFAIGYGADKHPDIFDLLNTVKRATDSSDRMGVYLDRNKKALLENILNILQINGAPYVRNWASIDTLQDIVSHEESKIFLAMLINNERFKTRFVNDCLPEQCKAKLSSARAFGSEVVRSTSWIWGDIFTAQKESWDGTTKESVKEAVNKGLALIWQMTAVQIDPYSVLNVRYASDILHGCSKEKDLTNEQAEKLLKTVNPFIYGGTPMYKALNQANHLFSMPEYTSHTKMLFILSDGEPSDTGTLPNFTHSEIYVVSCYITDSPISEPKCLYSTERHKWEQGAKFLFRLSSTITTQRLPRTIFIKRDWKIDTLNNETKLFFQVNHPDLISEVCSLAKEVVCSQDSLSDLLASISLDLYINQTNDEFRPKAQEGKTCYANASATVLHLAMKQIVGRDNGYPDFFDIRRKLIAQFGKVGAKSFSVLQEICPLYRLRCKEVTLQEAMTAITEKRLVLARFSLTEQEWKLFKRFFKNKPRDILTVNDLDIGKRSAGPKPKFTGHAIVLTSFNHQCLRFMNSWGTNFGDNGFFKLHVHSASVLRFKFVVVYWVKEDLTASEIEAYKREGPIKADKLMKTYKGLQTATFTCPLEKCHQTSKVTEFTGKLVKAICPKCKGEFDTNDHDTHDLVLNMYLTSLQT